MSSTYAKSRYSDSLAVLPTEARTRTCEMDVVKRLLAREGRDPWTRVQLECATGGNALDLSDALSNLAAAGVIRLSEEIVTFSRVTRDQSDPSRCSCGKRVVRCD